MKNELFFYFNGKNVAALIVGVICVIFPSKKFLTYFSYVFLKIYK